MNIKINREWYSEYLFAAAELTWQNPKDIKTIILHHSASMHDEHPLEINGWHIRRGMRCIGYHYYITKDGTIYGCRYIDTVGAHCKGHNKNTVGVCLSGDFTKEMPTDKELKALKELIKYIECTVGHKLDIKNHREYARTLCPGCNLKEILRKIKEV